jgi:hypothetical protein
MYMPNSPRVSEEEVDEFNSDLGEALGKAVQKVSKENVLVLGDFDQLISMTGSGRFCSQLRRSFGLGIWEFHFYMFQNFDYELRYACFSIFFYLKNISVRRTALDR